MSDADSRAMCAFHQLMDSQGSQLLVCFVICLCVSCLKAENSVVNAGGLVRMRASL